CWTGDHEDGIRFHAHCRCARRRPTAEDLLAMHEMGIACSILEAVHKELQSYPDQRASKVALRIGEFAGVDTESLRFCFEVIAKESALARLELEIEWCRVEDGRRGDELELAYLEIDDARTKEVTA